MIYHTAVYLAIGTSQNSSSFTAVIIQSLLLRKQSAMQQMLHESNLVTHHCSIH